MSDFSHASSRMTRFPPNVEQLSIERESTVTWLIARRNDVELRFPLKEEEPRLQLRDFDEATYLPSLNRSLAEKIKCIHVYANGYKIDEFPKSSFNIDATEFESSVPYIFSAEEMTDPWVRIRPNTVSAFTISFS